MGHLDNKRIIEIWNTYEQQKRVGSLSKYRYAQLYYRIIDEIKLEQRLWFIIRGKLVLEEKKEYWIDNDICFYSAYDDDLDPSHKSDKKIIQYGLGLDDIEGYCKINTSGKQDEAIIKTIEDYVVKIQKMTDLLSMVFRTALEWYPAMKIIKNDCGKPFILYEMSDNTAFTVAKNSRILEVIEEYKLLNGIKKDDIFVVNNLISWLALANSSQSVTYSFLVYWQVIELIAEKVYKNNKTKSENNSIMVKLNALVDGFYNDREKMKDKIKTELKSFHKIRNDIAHGNADVNDYLVNHNFDRKLYQIKEIAYEIAIKYIEKVTSEFRERT